MISEIEIKIVPDENGNPVIHRVRTIRKYDNKFCLYGDSQTDRQE